MGWKFPHFFLGDRIGFFGEPTKIDTESANGIRVSQKPLWDNFCTSQGTTVKELFPSGLRKETVKTPNFSEVTIFATKKKPQGFFRHSDLEHKWSENSDFKISPFFAILPLQANFCFRNPTKNHTEGANRHAELTGEINGVKITASKLAQEPRGKIFDWVF